MNEGLDLSKIVSTILENPSLVAQISAIAEKSNVKAEEEKESETTSVQDTSVEEAPTVRRGKDERRTQLLAAMKPYLSEERSRTIDTMLSIVSVLGAVRGK